MTRRARAPNPWWNSDNREIVVALREIASGKVQESSPETPEIE